MCPAPQQPGARDPATSLPEQSQPPSSATQPARASSHQILSIQIPATVQSGSLWRDPCIGGTLAGNYRVGDYVDYSGQDSHPGEQSQQQHAYDSPVHHLPHQQQQQQHRGSIHHSGSQPGGLHEGSDPHHGNPHAQHPGMSQHHQQPPSQMLMDPSQLGHHRLGPPHYGGPGQVMTPLYQSMSTPTHSAHTQHHGSGNKRPRPSDLDLSVAGMSNLEHANLETMQQTPLGAAYAQAAAAAVGQAQGPPTHHHHRLPDSSPPSKMMRRDEGGGGAPSVVGQAGMPAPAPRPRGPKLKFTPEDDQLLIDLKEHKNLTWKQIADFFPGRSSGTLQVRYCTKLKAKTTQWTDETDQKLRTALQDYENEKWRIVANKVGTGFTPAACRERADELQGGDSVGLYPSTSPVAVSNAESGDAVYQQQLQ
ncbi:Fc.00g006980.m01.CDS01 [Cosmosporella sp. VM-42]